MTQTTLYRMVMPQHICPYGLKAKHLLERKGFTVDDHWLETRAQTDAFKAMTICAAISALPSAIRERRAIRP